MRWVWIAVALEACSAHAHSTFTAHDATATHEDPALKDGIYTVDVRNGLYVLRYHGWHGEQLSQLAFAEGNSNL